MGIVNNRLFVKANNASNGPEFAINSELDNSFEMAVATFSPSGSFLETRCGYAENNEAFNAYNYSTSTIGATGGLVDAFIGDIAAIAIYDRVLTDQEIFNVQAYFASLYGLPMPNKTDLNSNRTFDQCEPDGEMFLNSDYISVELVSPASISGLVDNAVDAQFVGESDVHHNANTHIYTGSGPIVLRFDLLGSFDIYKVHFWNYFSEQYDVDDVQLEFYGANDTLLGSYQYLPLSSIDPSFAETRTFEQVHGVDYVIATLSGSNGAVDFQNIGFTAIPSSALNVPIPLAFVGVLLVLLVWVMWKKKYLRIVN